MMNEIMNFDGSSVSVIQIDGEPMFELYSTGAALGYVKSSGHSQYPQYPRKDRIDTVCKNAEITPFVHSGHTYLNESQLYDFMLEARTDKCRAFRKWVTEEVLPSIRRTGEYAPQRKSIICNSTYNGQTVMTFAEIEAVSGIPQWFSRDFVLRKCKRNVDFIVLRGDELSRFKIENNFSRENVNALTIVSQRCLCKLYEVYKVRRTAPPAKRIETKQPQPKKRKTKPDPHEIAAYVSSLSQSKREKFIGAFVCAMIGK